MILIRFLRISPLRLNLIEQKSTGKVLDLLFAFTSIFDLLSRFRQYKRHHNRGAFCIGALVGRGRRTQVCRFRRKPKWRCSAAKANLVRSAPRAERGGPNPGGGYHNIEFVTSVPLPPIFRFGAKRNIAITSEFPCP